MPRSADVVERDEEQDCDLSYLLNSVQFSQSERRSSDTALLLDSMDRFNRMSTGVRSNAQRSYCPPSNTRNSLNTNAESIDMAESDKLLLKDLSFESV